MRFENFTLDIARRELRRGTELIAIEPQVFDLLSYVISNRDRVVSKDDLVEAVWAGRAVSDSTLTTRINAMRKALGDSGEEQRLIRTIARKGLRFVGTVRDDIVPEDRGNGSYQQPTGLSPMPGLPLPDKPSIAVLPFENMSGDPEQDYFSDGISEDIITALSKWHWFFVIARNSSFTYKGSAVDVRRVGTELGVHYVLEGSVRKIGRKVRITAQLIDTTDGAHVWAERFDREAEDVFDLQDEISGRIAFALNIELTEAESKRRNRERPNNPAAIDLVFRARALQNRLRDRSAQQIQQVRQLLMQAAALDDTTPGLYTELARAHHNDFSYGFAADRARALEDGEIAANRAIELDSSDAYAHMSLGASHRFHGRFDRALAEYRVALDLNPNFALAKSHIAATLVQMGRPEEALPEALRAYRLDPRHRNMLIVLTQSCLHADRFNETIEWGRRLLDVAPESWFGYIMLAAALFLSGQAGPAEEAVAELLRTQSIVRTARDLRSVQLTGSPAYLAKLERTVDVLKAAGLPE